MNNHERPDLSRARQGMSERGGHILALTVLLSMAGVSRAQLEPGTVAIGSYDGFLVQEETFGLTLPSIQGTVSVKVRSEEGRLTAKVRSLGGQLKFSSPEWDSTSEHVCAAVLTARGGERLTLAVIDGKKMDGQLEFASPGGTPLVVVGSRNRFLDREDAEAQGLLADFRGYYTASLTQKTVVWEGAAHAAPRGIGYLTVTIGKRGSAKIAGRLADGTSVSQASQLIYIEGAPVMYVPFFVPLYRKTGWIGGLLTIESGSGVLAAPIKVCWDKPGKGPDGFQMVLEVCGGYYSSLLGCCCGYGIMRSPLAAAYLFYGEAPSGMLYHTPGGGTAEYVDDAILHGIGVETFGRRMVMDAGVKPVRNADRTYTYPPGNSALAKLKFNASTGIFRGTFNLYSDYASELGKPCHKTVAVSYAGVLTPVRDVSFAGLPEGMGAYLVPDNDPAVAVYRLKRSFPCALSVAP